MKAATTPIRAIVFDLDDTLVDSSAAYEAGNAAAFAAAGIEASQAEFHYARGMVKSHMPAGQPACHNRWLYFKCLLEVHGLWTPRRLSEVMAAYEEAQTTHIRRQWQTLKRDDLLLDLASPYQLAIVTNETLRAQVLKLNAMGRAAQHVEHLVTSEEYGVEKPNPALLKETLRRLGLPAESVCVIGDSRQNDIEPAVALGCRAVLTLEFHRDATSAKAARPSQGPGQDRTAVPIVSDLKDIIHYVA